MRVWLRIALAATVLGETATLAQQAEILTPENAIRDQYIVVLHDEEPSRAGTSVAVLARSMAGGRGGRVTRVYTRVLKGFAVSMSAAAARALANDPRVRYIEQDSVMYALDAQTSATWGLDRIDQRDLPLSTTYTYDTSGAGVHSYLIDTCISSTHTEFGGRVSALGYTAIDDGRGTNDCNGHGTHVAGTGIGPAVDSHV
jgi:subtilisin family serine protease